MDHSGMSMATTTATSSSAAPASSGMSMGGGMDMGGRACKISMLWNWNTIDSCFLARSWRITSNGMFAGSCIGVVLLVVLLEALRRAAREYDAYLVRKRVGSAVARSRSTPAHESQSGESDIGKFSTATTTAAPPAMARPQTAFFRPTLLEQLLRALLHMLQFAVAYFVMLLAMYYNGYIIICIFIGAFIGAFVFNWTTMSSENREITFCCG